MQKDKVVAIYRKAIESLYTGNAEVIIRNTTKGPVTKVSKSEENSVYENIPCRLSFATAQTIKEGRAVADENKMTLFTSPEIDIKPNSKITVTQNGYTYILTNANKKSYATHNEYSCTEFLRWL